MSSLLFARSTSISRMPSSRRCKASACSSSASFASLASASASLACSVWAMNSCSAFSACRCRTRSVCWSSDNSFSARATNFLGRSSRRAVSMAWDSPIAFCASLKVGLPSLYSIATVSVRLSSIAQLLSCRQCVVATTLAPDSRKASIMACASAAPCCGSVPVPASSTRTKDLFLEVLVTESMIRDATRCAEYVDKSSTIVCISPTSASTTLKKSTLGASPPGTGMPQRASKASRPIVFSNTVLPPAFGPLMMRP
mmetsp:Transcript_71813/g.126825  ORF Transcript_71813/g.126825 Transcript_71813/m.126825 type:complete len:255 (+) Transcript_71813:737-1501(+)